MFIISFFVACYLMRWSVNLLSGNMVADQGESSFVFGVGIVTVPIAAWAGLHIILN